MILQHWIIRGVIMQIVTACEVCFGPLPERKAERGRPRRFCSNQCRNRSSVRKTKRRDMRPKHLLVPIDCGRCGERFHPVNHEQRFCSAECRHKSRNQGSIVRECFSCKASFSSETTGGYCSDSCRKQGKRDRERRTRVALMGRSVCRCGKAYTPKPEHDLVGCISCRAKRLVAERRATRIADREATIPKVKKWAKANCRRCGVEFDRKTSAIFYCSTACRGEAMADRFVDRPVLYSGMCVECGQPFDSRCRNKIVCSARCGKALAKRRRRAVKLAAYVEPVGIRYLIDRDRGVCMICNEPVDLGAVAPHPRSPSLDHVVPLAKGGKHSKANCQLAHFLCNAIKADSMPQGAGRIPVY